MRLLGSNLMPFSVAQLPGTWSTGIEVEAYYFEGDVPTDLSQYFLDHRKLIADCVAASRIVLRPTEDGFLLMHPYSNGIKAVAGSVYDPKLGVTIHYPKNIIPRRTISSTSTFDIDTAYTTSLQTGNKKMKQHLSLGMFPGFPIGAQNQLMDFTGTMSGQIATVADLVFDDLKVFDGVLSDSPVKTAAATLQIIAAGAAEGSSAIGTTATITVPVGVATNTVPTTISSDILRVVGNANARRVLPVSIGDKGTAKTTKTIGHAILLIADTNSGALAAGNYDIRFMALEVGEQGSGALIELESLSISTGEYPEVLNVRTAKGFSTTGGTPDWVSPDAKIAFDSTKFIASPSKDILGNSFTYTGWPVQGDGSIRGIKGSMMEFPASTPIDLSQSFYLEFDYRQDTDANNAEINLVQIHTSFTDRMIIALDQSNETGFVLWNNRQESKVARPFSAYAGLKTTTFKHIVYQYDADTSTHTFKIDGVTVDTFTYKMLACTHAPIQIYGVYGLASLPTAFIKNYQLVQGKKVDLSGSGIYEVLNLQTGETKTAYINDTDGGGQWMLVATWRNFGASRTFSQLIQKGFNVSPLDEIADPLYPCYPVAFANTSEEWMFTSDISGWVSLYGDFIYGKTFDVTATQIGSTEAIPVTSGLGAKSVYGRGTGWNENTLMSDVFGLWTQTGNGGPCGGANIVGGNKICPTVGNWGSAQNHCDTSGTKRLYLRINPANFKLTKKL